MLSKEAILIESSSRLQSLFSITKGMYSRVKNSHKYIQGSCSIVEPYIVSMTTRVTSMTEPALTILSSSVSNCIEYGSNTLEKATLTLSEKKIFYKALAKAWLSSKSKNFSEFLETLQTLYPVKLTEQLEKLASDFYYKSLKYQPREVLKLVAELLSEGSEQLHSSLDKAKNFELRHYFTELKELLGDKWNEKTAEAAKIYKSLLKIKEKLVFEEGFTQDWSVKAKKSAEMASLLIIAGADEVYFWSVSTFGDSHFSSLAQVSVHLPFKPQFLALLQTLQSIEKKDILDLTWPEDYKNSVRPVIRRMGLDNWVESNWRYLDSDADGMVTVGDIFAAVTLLLSGSLEIAMKFVPFKAYMIKNGEA